jgi:hypothetical protein
MSDEIKVIKKNIISSNLTVPDYFTMCFEGMTRDKGLTMSSIYGYIWRKAQKYGYSYVSHNTMHKDLKLDVTTIRNNLNKLVEMGFLVVLDTTKKRRPKKIDPCTISYVPNDIKYGETYIVQEEDEENDDALKLSPEETAEILSGHS